MISLTADQPVRVRPGLAIPMATAMAISLAAVVLLSSFSKELALAGIGAAIAIVSCMAVVYTTRHREWLVFALTLANLMMAGALIPDTLQTAGHYALDFAICIPVIPFVWRSGVLAKGGYRLYVVFFLWALVTLCYSLDPVVSVGRLARSVLVFCAVVATVSEIEGPEDVIRVLERYLLACGTVLALTAVVAVLLPHDYTWGILNMPDSNGLDLLDRVNPDLNRFRGLFDQPNHIGELMLITVGPALICWPYTRGWKRPLITLAVVLSVAFTILAQSRSSFVAMAVGIGAFLIWKYRARAVVSLAVLALVFSVFLVVHQRLSNTRMTDFGGDRDITTLTGRTEIWQFAIRQILNQPFTGYGYAVEGEVFQSRHFPLWWGPWDLGSHISMHNGFISRAIGVGIPAFLFWLFIVMRPWVALFRQRDDPWNLKPIALLIVLPLMVHNLAESAVGDFIYQVGILFGLTWAIAERQRLMAIERAVTLRVESLAQLPRAVAAIVGSLVIVAGVLSIPKTAAAREFYVNSIVGSDSNPGTSAQLPLKSLAAVQMLRPSPGDRIFLARGQVWREMLTIDSQWAGTSAAPITLSAYGSGPTPIISGTDLVSSFKPAGKGTVYQTEVSSPVERVFVDGDGYIANLELADPALLTPGSWAQSANLLYLRLPDETSPSQHRIEVSVRRWGIHCWQCRYVVLEGIEIWGSWDDGINVNGPVSVDAPTTNVAVSQCVIRDIGRGGGDECGVQVGSTYARSITVESSKVSRIGLGRSGMGIVFNRCEGCVARGNDVSEAGHIGIAVQVTTDVPGLPGPDHAQVVGNRVHDCPGSLPGREHADAIYVRAAKNVNIADNEIWNVESPKAGSGNAIHVGRLSGNVIVTDNKVRNCTGGVYVDSGHSGFVRIGNNTFSSVRLFAARVFELDQPSLTFSDNSYSEPIQSSPFVVGNNGQRLTLSQWRMHGQN
jgi:O-Antigen ligase/Right handed beta helix region